MQRCGSFPPGSGCWNMPHFYDMNIYRSPYFFNLYCRVRREMCRYAAVFSLWFWLMRSASMIAAFSSSGSEDLDREFFCGADGCGRSVLSGLPDSARMSSGMPTGMICSSLCFLQTGIFLLGIRKEGCDVFYGEQGIFRPHNHEPLYKIL